MIGSDSSTVRYLKSTINWLEALMDYNDDNLIINKREVNNQWRFILIAMFVCLSLLKSK